MDMVGDESVPDRGPTVIATAASLAVIAAILVAIRIARRIYTSALGLDDYLIVVAVVSVYLSWTVKVFRGAGGARSSHETESSLLGSFDSTLDPRHSL